MQRLNIKTARRLETQIDDEITRMKHKLLSLRTVRFHSASESITSTEDAMTKILDKINTLVDIKFDIRKGISLFNASTEINELCIAIAKVSHDMEIYDLVHDKFSAPQAVQDYGSNTTFYTGGMSEDEMETFYVNSLKNKRYMQRIKDKCTGINSSGHIELDEESIKHLKLFGLMD